MRTRQMAERSLIVAGVRTPIGAMSGQLAGVSAPQLGAACIKVLISRTGHRRRDDRRSDHGQRDRRRAGSEPGPAGGHLRRIARVGRGRHGQQGMRLRVEGGHARRPGDPGWRCGNRDRRRHGKHDAGALSADQGPRGLPAGPRRAPRRHDPSMVSGTSTARSTWGPAATRAP